MVRNAPVALDVLLIHMTSYFKLGSWPLGQVCNYHAIAYFALLAKDNKVRKLRVMGVLAYFLHRELSTWVKEHIWYQVYESLYKFEKVFRRTGACCYHDFRNFFVLEIRGELIVVFVTLYLLVVVLNCCFVVLPHTIYCLRHLFWWRLIS